jgi:pyridoxine 5-phosphate synthase
MVELGVNIDHVATVRQARQTYEPDPAWAAVLAELGGADGITIHLREDRRHIQDRDLRVLRETVQCRINLELACDQEIVQIGCQSGVEQATLVPEKREEVTTEGGLDAVTHFDTVKSAVAALQQAGILVSLFLDPEPAQIEAAARMGAEAVELHTGQYALAAGSEQQQQLELLEMAGQQICQAGMLLHAGHGLNYRNVRPVAALDQMRELNIGHAIVARAVMVGMQQAVCEMKSLL